MSATELRPTRAEIRGRLEAVAGKARERGIDALAVLDPANVYYLSGFRTTLHTRLTAVALRTDAPAEALLIAPSVDRRLALEPVWYPSLLERTEIYYEGAPAGGVLASEPGPLLDRVVQNGDTLGVDLATAGYGQVGMLAGRYQGARIADASELLHDARRVKSAFELAALRRANAVAITALSQVPQLLHAALSEVELATALDGIALAEGADGFAYPTLIGFGPKSLAPHAPPTIRQLERNQLVTIAFGPTVAGYCADIVRTFCYGSPPERAVDSGRQVVEVQAAALGVVRAGASAGELMQAANRTIARLFPGAPVAGRAGHSLGLTIHETPSLTPDSAVRLEPDMVLAIEPGTPASPMEGIGLYRHCDVVRVTADGYELLTPFERGLLVVPMQATPEGMA
ncbi:MAG TPA: Xaa-Pro peptidase family protein [Thermomicrobiaceae bacterium]|nr:Xaa-Pro peptidase family protein [Thermomicrobiaceae bacterium]